MKTKLSYDVGRVFVGRDGKNYYNFGALSGANADYYKMTFQEKNPAKY